MTRMILHSGCVARVNPEPLTLTLTPPNPLTQTLNSGRVARTQQGMNLVGGALKQNSNNHYFETRCSYEVVKYSEQLGLIGIRVNLGFRGSGLPRVHPKP